MGNKLKYKYVPPCFEVHIVFLEQGIAAGSSKLIFEGEGDPVIPEVHTWENLDGQRDELEL